MISIGSACSTGYYDLYSDCETPTKPDALPGSTWRTEFMDDKVIFQKIPGSSTEGVYIATFAPGSSYHFISWNGTVTMNFSINPEIFRNIYNDSLVTFGQDNITLNESGRLYGSAASRDQNFEITYSEINGWVCYGITETLGSIDKDVFKGIGKGYCTNNIGNTTYDVTLSCPEECVACDSSCAVCTGETNNDCSSCNSGFFLQPFSTTCSSNRYTVIIKSHTFKLNQLGCHSTCYTCDGANNNNCLSCTESLYLYQSTCTAACPSSGYFTNSDNNKCDGISHPRSCFFLYFLELACNSTCLTCNGTTATTCLSCATGRFLYQTTCVTECPDGTYPDTSDNTCKRINNKSQIFPYSLQFFLFISL